MAKSVEVMSSCLVGSSTTTSMSRLELTAWDLRLLQTNAIQRGLIFHYPQLQFQQTLIQHLKNSFSRTLHFFPPLAGRLAATAQDEDGATTFFVDCNNAGAEFTHAVAAAVSISDILKPTYIPEIVCSLFPLNDVTNFEGTTKPLFAVQVTELADGLFLGCAANHAVVDGTSFWHFFNSWSEISRGSDTISEAPVFERWFPSNDNRFIHLPKLFENVFAPSLLPQKVFHFSKESLARLKAKANSEAATHKISTLQAVLAHLWRSTARCRRDAQTVNGDSQETAIMMAIGARARTPSLADGYFGNAAYLATLAMRESDLLQNGLGAAALEINDMVSQQTNEEAIRRYVEEAPILGGGDIPPPPRRASLIIGSSPRHDVYGCDFGWGKPVAVRSGKAQKFDGLVVAFPAAEAGGIDVEVCLARETLDAMECDAEFMAVFTT